MTGQLNELTVETPMGTIVAYPSIDPLNPGIFIDLRRDGYKFSLNLATIKCNIDEDTNEPVTLALHAWEVATQEDATINTTFSKIDTYFDKK